MGFNQGQILVGLGKAVAIAKERSDSSMYGLFLSEAEPVYIEYSGAMRDTHQKELIWHAEIDETGAAFNKGKATYYKYRDLVTEELSGAGLMKWEVGNITPDELDVALEYLIGIIEENKEKLSFAQIALDELIPVSEKLEKEVQEDRESYRAYRNAVNKKNALVQTAYYHFLRMRRFIRNDLGYNSVEYGQLKDRAVRKATKEQQTEENQETQTTDNMV